MAPPNPPPDAATLRRPSRLLAGLGATALVCLGLVVLARLGASWPVVVVAVVGTGLSLWLGNTSRLRALSLVVVVAAAGLLGLEGVNAAQYGTLSLSGPPAHVWWCGDTYSASGAVTGGLAQGDGPPFSQILTTPAAYSVYAGYRAGTTCGATGPLLVQIGPGRYEIYNP